MGRAGVLAARRPPEREAVAAGRSKASGPGALLKLGALWCTDRALRVFEFVESPSRFLERRAGSQ